MYMYISFTCPHTQKNFVYQYQYMEDKWLNSNSSPTVPAPILN